MKLRMLRYHGDWFGGIMKRPIPWSIENSDETTWQHRNKGHRDESPKEYIQRKLSPRRTRTRAA